MGLVVPGPTVPDAQADSDPFARPFPRASFFFFWWNGWIFPLFTNPAEPSLKRLLLAHGLAAISRPAVERR